MAGHKVDAQRDIIAEPEDVWSVLIDIDRSAKVLRSVDKVERIEGAGFAVGVKWRESRRLFGKTELEEMTVVEVDAPRRAVIDAVSETARYRTEYLVQPSSLGTRLRIEFDAGGAESGAGQKLVWALFGRVGARAAKAALEEDLEDIAKAVESRSVR